MEHSADTKKLGRKLKGLYQPSVTEAPVRRKVNYEGSHVVYGLASSHEPNTIRYVGFTSQTLSRRYSGHLATSKKNITAKDKWIHDLMAVENEIILIVLEDGIQSENQACLKEKEFIYSYTSSGVDLKNATIGGIGPSGYLPSKETKMRQSKANKGKQFKLGKIVSDATRKKISDSNKKYWLHLREPLKENLDF